MKSPRRYPRKIHDYLCDETRERAKTSAIVFAPHQDDETLGCGGTVILKTRSGASATLVFMTDGTTSHRKFMREEELRSLRKTEARDAAGVLGVAPGDVHFLEFPDGDLMRFQKDAASKVVVLLDRYRPREVYVPYRFDGMPDHESTYAVVVDAIDQAGLPVEICEYPVWFWNRWPWVPMEWGNGRESLREIFNALWARFGSRRFREFQSGVFIGDVLEQKRQALARYRSQMTVLVSGTDWPTLTDISAGEFLRCFFQDYEVFRCWNFPARGGGHPR